VKLFIGEGCMNTSSIHPDVRIGHVHLQVANLDRATAFYRDVLGFEVTLYGPDIGVAAAWLVAGDYHHHIALNTWLSEGGTPPPVGHTGLHHVEIVYPNRRELARAVKRVLDHGYALDEAERHSVSEAVFLHDPDRNGLDLYYDLPREQWPIANGKPVLTPPQPFDLDELLAE